MSVAMLAIGLYVYIPGVRHGGLNRRPRHHCHPNAGRLTSDPRGRVPAQTYSKEQPLKTWTFTVALPRAKVERLLIHDFHDTAKLWMNGVESVERLSGKVRTLAAPAPTQAHRRTVAPTCLRL